MRGACCQCHCTGHCERSTTAAVARCRATYSTLDRLHDMIYHHFTIAWRRVKSHEARFSCVLREVIPARRQAQNAVETGFLRSGALGTTVGARQGCNRHMWHGGFWRNAVARGCQSRLAEGPQAERLWIDSADAPMPWLREAEKLANLDRVGFASPSTIHQEAVSRTNT